jgi:hypothetical protein
MKEEGSTYLALTSDDLGGRYAAISPTHIVGQSAACPVAGGQRDPVPDEPPLCFNILARLARLSSFSKVMKAQARVR